MERIYEKMKPNTSKRTRTMRKLIDWACPQCGTEIIGDKIIVQDCWGLWICPVCNYQVYKRLTDRSTSTAKKTAASELSVKRE